MRDGRKRPLKGSEFPEREENQLSYILHNVEVRIARYGEPAARSFRTDVFVDTCSRPRARYQYGIAYRDEHTDTFYLKARETLAWHELLILPDDDRREPGFKHTAAEMKLARGRAIEAARKKIREAENELRRLVA